MFLTIGCSKPSTNTSDSNNTSESTNIDETDFNQLIDNWNKAHSSKDVAVFSELFDNSVFFYGIQKDKNACIETKLTLFRKYPDFHQQTYGEIETERLNEKEVKCTFIKRVTVNQKTKDYPSYLIFQEKGGEWKIVTEGDLITDKNIAQNKEPKNTQKNKHDYNYEPIISVISGEIKIESFFGPPGYGENPQTDSREDSYILNIDNSINVISETKEIEEGDPNTTKFNIVKIQLSSTSGIDFSNYINKPVRLTGTFFGAHSGHHNTAVLLDVSKVEKL